MAEDERAGGPWDTTPFSVSVELQKFLYTMTDQGKGMDTGGGDGVADIWAWVGGREFHIQIKPSNAQLRREAARSPETRDTDG